MAQKQDEAHQVAACRHQESQGQKQDEAHQVVACRHQESQGQEHCEAHQVAECRHQGLQEKEYPNSQKVCQVVARQVCRVTPGQACRAMVESPVAVVWQGGVLDQVGLELGRQRQEERFRTFSTEWRKMSAGFCMKQSDQ